MTHHIRQYHLHVALHGTEADGLMLQSQLSRLCADYLLPALAQVLDRCAPPGVHLVLDRLDLEAGPLALDRLEQDAPALLAQAVEKALQEKTAQLPLAPQPAAADLQVKTTPQTVEEAFFHFLNTGQLPWAFRLPEGRQLEQAVLGAWAAVAGPAAITGRVREALRRALAAATVRQRLAWQFSAAFREKLMATLWPESQRTLAAVGGVLQLAGKAFGPALDEAVSGFERLLWEVALTHIARGAAPNADEAVREAWLRLPASARQQTGLQAVLEKHWPGSTQPPAAAGSAAAAAATRAASPEAGPAETPATGAGNLPELKQISYLDNAGLVLLHPFLPRFFEGLGLTKNNQLLQPERALCLLHFLATGQRSAPEYALALPKLLCAVPLGQPVATDLPLTAAEIDEAEVLLQAVVQHWTALRSTSPDALRGTFLARAGKLAYRPQSADWLLQVEPMSYDILLDQLPWGVSMIQLPWMPRLLRVEWG
ncbi:contractile injection system tape measure protein [Hymenobacter daeguensis]